MDLLDKKLWLNNHGNTMEMGIVTPDPTPDNPMPLNNVVVRLTWKPRYSSTTYESNGDTSEETYSRLFELVGEMLYKKCK